IVPRFVSGICGGVSLLYSPFTTLQLHLFNELLDFAGAITKKSRSTWAASQSNHRQSRHLSRRVISHPIDGNAQPLSHLLGLKQMIVIVHCRKTSLGQNQTMGTARWNGGNGSWGGVKRRESG